jgi:hypothetical protein
MAGAITTTAVLRARRFPMSSASSVTVSADRLPHAVRPVGSASVRCSRSEQAGNKNPEQEAQRDEQQPKHHGDPQGPNRPQFHHASAFRLSTNGSINFFDSFPVIAICDEIAGRRWLDGGATSLTACGTSLRR